MLYFFCFEACRSSEKLFKDKKYRKAEYVQHQVRFVNVKVFKCFHLKQKLWAFGPWPNFHIYVKTPDNISGLISINLWMSSWDVIKNNFRSSLLRLSSFLTSSSFLRLSSFSWFSSSLRLSSSTQLLKLGHPSSPSDPGPMCRWYCSIFIPELRTLSSQHFCCANPTRHWGFVSAKEYVQLTTHWAENHLGLIFKDYSLVFHGMPSRERAATAGPLLGQGQLK